MLDILKFVFQDFWHWLGAFLMLVIVAEGIRRDIYAPRLKPAP